MKHFWIRLLNARMTLDEKNSIVWMCLPVFLYDGDTGFLLCNGFLYKSFFLYEKV